MKKILYGILAVFMSFALAYGTTYIIDNSLSTSTEVVEEDEVNTSATSTRKWIDIVNDGSNNYFSKYGGKVDETNKTATIQAALANETFTVNNELQGIHGTYNKAALALAGWNLCTRTWDYWREYTLIIECDIDMSGALWTPVGTWSEGTIWSIGDFPFTGTFDGQGHTINNVIISYENFKGVYKDNKRSNMEHLNIGFFGHVKDAEIKNFSITGKIQLSTDSNDSYTINGFNVGIIGMADGETFISEVFNEGFNITYNRSTFNTLYGGNGTVMFGGIVGATQSQTVIWNCINKSGNIETNVPDKTTKTKGVKFIIGGVVGGLGSSKISYCASYASIQINNPTKVDNDNDNYYYLAIGGVVGLADRIYGNSNNSIDKDIEYCTFSGEIKTTGYFYINGAAYVGGIVACAYDIYSGKKPTIEIYYCHNYGSISFSDAHELSVGGIMGYITGKSSTCIIAVSSNYGDINITANRFDNESYGFGGILGCAGQSGDVTDLTYVSDCVNYGKVSVTGGNNIKYVGGIVGHIWNNGLINTNMNYGQVEGKECVGGIAGELGRQAKTGGFLGIGNYSAYTHFALTNCINYGTYIKGEKSFGQIAGWINGDIVRGCYAISNSQSYDKTIINIVVIGNKTNCSQEEVAKKSKAALLDGNFIRNASWFEGSLNEYDKIQGFENTTFTFSGYGSYNNGTWLLSTVAYNYYGASELEKKGMTKTYSWVLYSSVSNSNVELYWQSNSSAEFQKFGNDYSAMGTLKFFKLTSTLQYNTGKYFFSTNWIDVKGSVDTNPEFFRGANYINLGISFKQLELSLTSNFTLQSYSAETKIDDRTYQEKISVKTYFGSRNVLFQASPLKKDSSGLTVPTLSFYFTSRTGTVTIIKTAGGNNKYDGDSWGTVKSKNKEITTISNLTYKQTITLTVTPDPGYYCDRIIVGNKNIDKSTTYGTQTFTFEYNFETEIEVHFLVVPYTMTIEFNETFGSRESITVSKFSRSYNDVESDSSKSIQNLGFGYTYSYKIKDKSTLKDNVEPTKSNSIKLQANELIGSDSNQMKNISTDTFTVVISRKAIDYTLNLVTYADSYKSNIFSKTDMGGTAQFKDKNSSTFTVKNTATISLSSNAGYSVGNIYFSESQVDEIGTDTDKFFTKESLTYEYYIQEVVNSYLEKFCEYDDKTQKWVGKENNSPNEIYVLVCFNLDGYKLSVSVSEEAAEGETTALNVTPTVAVEGKIDAENNIKYFAPVTITVPNAEGWLFTGFYIKDSGDGEKLLSLNSTYNFLVNPKKSKINSLNIVAKYEQYSTTEQSDFTSYYATTSNPNASAKNIYKIQTAEDLMLLSQKVNAGETFENVMFVQTANIDMTSIVFRPIGTSEHPFKGVYDGGNYTISNLTFVGGSNLSTVGLFGYTENATIKNLTIQNATVTGYSNVGAVAGTAINTTFERVNNYNSNSKVDAGEVEFVDIYGNTINATNAGVTYNYHTVGDDIEELADVENVQNSFEARVYFGGLVGYAEACTFYASSSRTAIVQGNAYSAVAGLVGSAINGKIDQCFVVGSLGGAEYITAGNSTISDCFHRLNDNSTNTTILNKTGDNLWVTINNRPNLKVFYWC